MNPILFNVLCSLLPEETNWGDELTPDLLFALLSKYDKVRESMAATITPKSVRKFTHVEGFLDDTNEISIEDGKVYRTNKSGHKLPSNCYSIKMCEAFVEQGLWKELT